MSSKHKNINATAKYENVDSLSFLDAKNHHKNSETVPSVSWQPTFSGVFTNSEVSLQRTKKGDF